MFEAPTLALFDQYNIGVALPGIFLAFWTMFVLLFDIFISEERQNWTPVLALSGLSASFVMTLFSYNPANPVAFGGMYVVDAFTSFANLIVLATAFIGILLSYDYLQRTSINNGEYYSLLLLSTAGVMFMTGANDLLMVFVSLEMLSIPLYVLAVFHATNRKVDNPQRSKSEESGMKYFVLGAFSSAFLVYGAAMVYGATGSTSLPVIFESIQNVLATSNDSGAVFLLLGGRPDTGRAWLQGGRRALPYVDAGCLRGRADIGDRLYERGSQGRWLRCAAARVRGRLHQLRAERQHRCQQLAAGGADHRRGDAAGR